MLLTICDNVANTHEITTKHPVRRRGQIHRARISTLSNMYIRFIKYVHLFHRTHIFVPHCGYNFQYSNILFEFKKNDLTTLTYFYKTFKIY